VTDSDQEEGNNQEDSYGEDEEGTSSDEGWYLVELFSVSNPE